MKRTPHRRKLAGTIFALVMSICLASGGFAGGGAYAASEFTSGTPFGSTGRSTYYHKAKYSNSLIVNGVDASYWQEKTSNWQSAANAGVEFAILRVTFTYYGRTTLTTDYDSRFKSHFDKAKAAGILRGVYVFSQARNASEGAKEAEYAIKRLETLGIGPEDLNLPLYMDYEFAGGTSGRMYGISKSSATAAAKSFCDTVRKAGYQPGVYANTSFFKNYIDASALGADVDLWCAQYYSRCESTVNYTKWQYSSSAKINGLISTSTGKQGPADVNFWYIDKTPAASRVIDIYAQTDDATGKALSSKFEIYDGTKLLKEGTDYNIGLVNNKNYAYIHGIGTYTGYALIPLSKETGYQKKLGADGLIDNAYKEKEVTDYPVRFIDADGNEIRTDFYEEGTAASDIAVPDAPVKEADDQYTYEFLRWEMQDGRSVSSVDGGAVYAPVFRALPEETDEAGGSSAQEEATGSDSEGSAEVTSETGESSDAQDDASQDAASEGEQTVTSEGTSDAETAEKQDAAPSPASYMEFKPEYEGELPEPQTRMVVTAETILGLDIGTNSYGSYVRNVPAGTTADALISGMDIKTEDQDACSIKVLTAKGALVSGDVKVKTGMMAAVYRGEELIGTADITVTGSTISDANANYLSKGTVIAPKTTKVTVKATTIKKLTRSRKAFTVKVKKLTKAQASGYQVRYSTKKNMSGAKTKTIGTSYSKVSKKITGLKAKKTYYVQVRTYRTVNGKKYYSSWSSKKKVKTK